MPENEEEHDASVGDWLAGRGGVDGAPARSGAAWADDAQDARHLVEKARLTVEEFRTDANMGTLRDLAKKAKGMLILPQMLRAAFLVGASGGNGVLVARDEKTGQWRGPAFYTLGGASFGFQAGADAAEVIILGDYRARSHQSA